MKSGTSKQSFMQPWPLPPLVSKGKLIQLLQPRVAGRSLAICKSVIPPTHDALSGSHVFADEVLSLLEPAFVLEST